MIIDKNNLIDFYNKKLLDITLTIHNRKYLFVDIVYIRTVPNGVLKFNRFGKDYFVTYELTEIVKFIENGTWNTTTERRLQIIKKIKYEK